MLLINKSKFTGTTYTLLINRSKFIESTNDIIYPTHINKLLIIDPTTGMSCILPLNYTGMSCKLLLNNKLTSDIIFFYESLMASKAIVILLIILHFGFSFVLSLLGRVTKRTKSLLFIKTLIFFLLLCNQVEGTTISLTNLNLITIPILISSSNISSTIISNPP